jgi:hypothetical protein
MLSISPEVKSKGEEHMREIIEKIIDGCSEVKILTTQNRTDFSRPPYEEFYRAIEAKLKEKNT